MGDRPPASTDLRMPAVGLAAWGGGIAGLVLAPPVLVGLLAAGAAVLAWRCRRGRSARTAAGLLLVLGALAGSAGLRSHQVAHNPVADLARRGATVTTVVSVSSDPRPQPGRLGDYVVFRGRVQQLVVRDTAYRTRAPVLVIAGPEWAAVELGSVVRVSGRPTPSEGRDLSAVLHARGGPVVVTGPAPWWRAADRVRQSLRDSVSGVPEQRRPLVPALVVGDDQGLDPQLDTAFGTTGLTHLLAVSGTNLTLLLGFVLVVARWVGVRGRWRYAVAVSGIVCFVLLARPEPSVLRAAVMGSVALVGLGTGGARRGARSLGVAVTALLLVDPWLAIQAGFALSVLATGGIVLLAPAWRDALSHWLPRWLAEAVAVPAAAQLACTPVVAALSGQVSLVAVLANLLAAPAVGPATVLGLAGGVVGLAWPLLGRLCGTLAGWCVGWIVAVAERGAALPFPSVEWATGPLAVAGLTALCAGAALVAPTVLRRRGAAVAGSLGLVAVVLVGPPVPGWPPPGWVLAVCDVGQGDGIVLNAGTGTGVVVDAGPDPAVIDRCLRRLRVRRVPLVVLTHFHDDHVGGLAGVVRDRAVGRIEVTPLADPPGGVALVTRVAGGVPAPVHPAPYAVTRRVGQLTLQVLWPPPGQPTRGPGDGSTANNASVVLLVDVAGVRILLGGDLEPEGQAAVAARLPGLRVDVVKVPHHGSRFQDLGFLGSLHARVALVSVGEDNDYGHPAAEVLASLERAGTEVLRTDHDGDLLVLVSDGRLMTRTRG